MYIIPRLWNIDRYFIFLHKTFRFYGQNLRSSSETIKREMSLILYSFWFTFVTIIGSLSEDWNHYSFVAQTNSLTITLHRKACLGALLQTKVNFVNINKPANIISGYTKVTMMRFEPKERCNRCNARDVIEYLQGVTLSPAILIQ